MKHLFTICLALAISLGSWAQAPDQFHYQAVARDTAGNPLATQSISLRFSILSGSATGTMEYQETHSTTTDGTGMFSLAIGNGSVVTGTFADIAWGSGDHFLKVELDPAGGSSYSLVGTQQLLSVPYALYANATTDLTTDVSNVILGRDAGASNTGSNNTFVGRLSGQDNTSATLNTMVGALAGQNTTTGYANVFLGSRTGITNTTGQENVFIGESAGYASNGSNNVHVGVSAGVNATTANNNVLVGSRAGRSITTGTQNTLLGTNAGFSATNTSGNVYIGYNAGYSNTSGTRNVFIGYQAGYGETGSNQFVLANHDDSASVLMYGDFSTGNIAVRGTVQTTAATDTGGAGNVPSGIIAMWSGDTAPSGWAICDGTNGTPDLRGRFVVGYDPAVADYDQPGSLSEGDTLTGATGGLDSVALTIDEMPSHNHGNRVRASSANSKSAVGTYPAGRNFAASAWRELRGTTYTDVNTNEIEEAGGGASHENRPPFYVLAYIMKL